jgi:hypothetical protein
MHEQYVKKKTMHEQFVKIHGKIILYRPTKINKLINKQIKLSLTRQVPIGVTILS